MALLTKKQIWELNVTRAAIFERLYFGDNGKTYKGLKNGQLTEFEQSSTTSFVPVETNKALDVQQAIENVSNLAYESSVKKYGQLISTYTAGQTLGGQRVVMVSGGKAFYFNPLNDLNIGKVLGITNQSATLNSQIDVVTGGSVVDIGWGLITDSIYYAGFNGTITTMLPISPFVFQRIGVATDANTLKLEFSEPVSTI